MDMFIKFLVAAVGAGTPLLFGTVGEILTEKVGHLNLGVEGMMAIGACAGSTGGGIKVSRIIILARTVTREVRQVLHPKSVNVVKLDGKRLTEENTRGVYVYMICYIAILAVSVLLISVDNFDFTTNFTAVLTTLNNVGPGLAKVGPVENFSLFSDFSKIVLSLDMLFGRLEIFPMIMLFSPSIWRRA